MPRTGARGRWLWAWLLVAFEHCGGDLGVAWPLALTPPDVGLILVEVIGIRLHGLSGFEEQQSQLIGRHAPDEGFGIIERRPQPRHDVLRIKRFARRQSPPLGR